MYYITTLMIMVLIINFLRLAVTVTFGQSLYSYSEDHGVVSDITIILSTVIAQSLTIIVFGGIELITLYTL